MLLFVPHGLLFILLILEGRSINQMAGMVFAAVVRLCQDAAVFEGSRLTTSASILAAGQGCLM